MSKIMKVEIEVDFNSINKVNHKDSKYVWYAVCLVPDNFEFATVKMKLVDDTEGIIHDAGVRPLKLKKNC